MQSVFLRALSLILLLGSTVSANEPLNFDICVYGESASGVIAAIQGARMGKKVILISKSSHVGGLATSGLTATDMNRNDLVGGVTREFYQRIYQYYLSPLAWKNQDRDSYMESTLKRTYTGRNEKTKIQWVYESSVAEKIFLEMLKEEQVKILFHHRLDLKTPVLKKDNRITAIVLENGSTIKAGIFIDASYEGDLMAGAGISYHLGRESNRQYGETLNGIRINYGQGTDITAVSPYKREGKPGSGLLPFVTKRPWGKQGEEDSRVQAYCYRMTLTNDPDNMITIRKPLNYNPLWFEVLARQLKAKPGTKLQQIITLTPMPNKKTDTNHLDFIGASYDYAEGTYQQREKIEQMHKNYALGKLWFLAHDKRVPDHIRNEMKEWGLPKDEFTDTENFPYQIYVREARRMAGEFVMTEQNIRKEDRIPADHSVGMGSYALDCHYVSRVVDANGKLRNEGTLFYPTTPYPISYYAITPKEGECSNLLVTVCLSASHVAYSSIRMEPVYMILGQSAATAASLAIDQNVPVQEVPYSEIKDRLLRQGQILSIPAQTK
ncbi:MAG: FAD-dependent oxidoreductase [Mangrovibacterium sp.]